jgi:hypothetical protein
MHFLRSRGIGGCPAEFLAVSFRCDLLPSFFMPHRAADGPHKEYARTVSSVSRSIMVNSFACEGEEPTFACVVSQDPELTNLVR